MEGDTGTEEKHFSLLTCSSLLFSSYFICIISWRHGSSLQRRKVKVLVIQSCLTFCNPLDYTLPASYVHGIFQARKNTEVGFHSLLGGIFPIEVLNPVSCIASKFFTVWATREAPKAGVKHFVKIAFPPSSWRFGGITWDFWWAFYKLH